MLSRKLLPSSGIGFERRFVHLPPSLLSRSSSFPSLCSLPLLSLSFSHQLLDNSRLLRCTAPGREALNILSGSGGSLGFGFGSTSRSPSSSSSSYALSPIPSSSSAFGGGGHLSLSPSMSSFNGLSGLGRRSINTSSMGLGSHSTTSNSSNFEPQMRWGMTLGGRR